MEYLHLECFRDRYCPPEVDHPLVKTLPINDLGPELTSRLEASLTVSEGVHRAKSARLWESLLEAHRIPYLLLRVADMRISLGRRWTALPLYEELQTILNDPELGVWIGKMQRFSMDFDRDELRKYKANLSTYLPSQIWRPTIGTPLPFCKLKQKQIKKLRDRWSTRDPHILMDKFLNMYCLETNKIERAINGNYTDSTRLVQLGFYHQMEPTNLGNIILSTARDRADVLDILRDTHETLRDVFELLKSEHIHLTIDGILASGFSRMVTIQVADAASRSYCNMDGNGRLSRMLASIPLLKAGLPPICIIPEHRESYIKSLNTIRAERDGDFRPLMDALYEATRSSLDALEVSINKAV
ncbi:predicted protein [Postia placenta Mad-698-R]|nr:predicted protein [Postia placenta Mad-698-R]